MDLLYIFVIACILAIDALVVSISCGISHSKSDLRFSTKVSLFFGLSQALFFAVGYIFGEWIHRFLFGIDHWIAFFLLSFVGVRMISESLRNWNKRVKCRLIGNRTLVILSVATSIDALVVGIIFAFLGDSLIIPAVVVGSVTFLFSFLGVVIGDKLSGHFGKGAEIIGGVVLVAMAVRVLFQGLKG